MRTLALRVATFAGYAAMGPITGPLAAGLVRNIRKREWILVGLYAVALALTYVELAALSGVALRIYASAGAALLG